MPKNPHADFSPVLKGYSGQSPFKFWCQMALPLTYDDSLSYYELLNKVVSYLNNTISDVANVEDNVGSLLTSFTQLQDYVNDYFDEIDVEAELRSVLDIMAEDGSLDAILSPIVSDQLPDVVESQIDAVVAGQIDESVGSQLSESVQEQLPGVLPEEVGDWLENNLTPTSPPVDNTLTIPNAAADAKKTGDEIDDLKTTINEFNINNLFQHISDYSQTHQNLLFSKNGNKFTISGTSTAIATHNLYNEQTFPSWLDKDVYYLIDTNTINENIILQLYEYFEGNSTAHTLFDGHGKHFIKFSNDAVRILLRLRVPAEITLNETFVPTWTKNMSNEQLTETAVKDSYYSEIELTKERYHDETDIYIAKIPLNDDNGELIDPYISHETEDANPLLYAIKNGTTITANTGIPLTWNPPHEPKAKGNIISQGVVLNSQDITDPIVANAAGYLTISKNRRTWKSWPITTTLQTLLADSTVYNCVTYYWKLIENGEIVNNDDTISNEGTLAAELNNPRMAIGYDSAFNIYIFACDGRTDINLGMKSSEVATYMKNTLGCVNAWHMDGGGTTALMYKGSKVNRNIDDGGTKNRNATLTFNFKKPGNSESIGDIFGQIGAEKQALIQQIIPYVNSVLNEVNAVKDTLYQKFKMYNVENYFDKIELNKGSHAGVSCERYGTGIKLNGVTNAVFIYDVYVDAFPMWLVPGKTYYAEIGNNDGIIMQIYTYNANANNKLIFNSENPGEFTVDPNYYTQVRIRLRYETINHSFNRVIYPSIREVKTNKELM